MTFTVFQCASCKKSYFPARHFCPACHRAEWTEITAQYGQVEDSTAVRHRPGADTQTTTYLATIRTTAGPKVIARLEEYMDHGDKVELRSTENGLLVAIPMSAQPR